MPSATSHIVVRIFFVTTYTSCDVVPPNNMHFGGFVNVGSFMGSNPPKSTIFGACIDIFKPNSQNIKIHAYRNYCIDSNQISHNDDDHRMLFTGEKKPAHNKSKMADGRHLEKTDKSPFHNATFVQLCSSRQDRASFVLAFCDSGASNCISYHGIYADGSRNSHLKFVDA